MIKTNPIHAVSPSPLHTAFIHIQKSSKHQCTLATDFALVNHINIFSDLSFPQISNSPENATSQKQFSFNCKHNRVQLDKDNFFLKMQQHNLKYVPASPSSCYKVSVIILIVHKSIFQVLKCERPYLELI